MNIEETKNLLKFLDMSYQNFEVTKEKINHWANELQQYELNDVKMRLTELMSQERYAFTAPLVEAIKSGLTKKYDKVDLSQIVYYCRHCRKAFNSIDETHKHEDRCSAVKYIERQYKRFKLGEINNSKKRELYNMPEQEFEEKYEKLLKQIQEKTTNELEQIRIGFIFNPPKLEDAKNFLKVN